MRFPPHLLDDIRARLPISQVVGRRVTWDKRKSNPGRGDWWACCPFHGEKTPSFHAEDRKGRYHCFGCGVSGDHFTFLVEAEGLSFPDAVVQLAAEAGVPLPERDPDSERREAERASLHDVLERAARFFESALQGPDGAKARAYLRERGIAPDLQKRFRLGYAPASRSALKEHLAGAGVVQEGMIEAGLLVSGDDIPVSFDRFRDRIMFPITDSRGRVIAFGGRALSADAQAKYLNSPETPLFSKSRVLYNAQGARAASRKGGHVVAVEGYIDVIACVAAGFEATVAPLGTALTEDQLRLLWVMADEPILCFDGDEAGLKAAFRAIDVALPLLAPGKSLRFALLPDGQDPDDLIRVKGAEAFEQVLSSAEPLAKMIVSRESQGEDFTRPERRAAFETRLYALAAMIGDRSVSRHYRDYFRLRMSELFWGSDGRNRRTPSLFTAHRPSPQRYLERIIVGLCVAEPSLFRNNEEELLDLEFSNSDYTRFFADLHKLLVVHGDLSVALIYGELGEKFYDTISETHGIPSRVVVPIRGATTKAGFSVSDGGQLRKMLPVIKLQPDYGLLEQTLRHFLLLLRLRRYRSEIRGSLSQLSDGRFAAMLKDLDEFQASVAESERELDAAYERLRFRSGTHPESLGHQLLQEKPPPWRQALRLAR